ncbi:claudin [Rhodnius prolixus]|uniref:claudin n=1 Tax=Rhodnius prolixus TaxID=13249 RepID=UPI003D18CCE5
MGKSLTGFISTGIAGISFLLIFIAFATPNWLETDNKLHNPKFQRIGLWWVCFSNFQDPHYWYDTKFQNCWWIFEEEYYIIFDFLLPGFFVAVQFFFTVCFVFHLIAIPSTLLYLACSRENYRFVHLLIVLGSVLILAGICGTIAVYIFGAYGDGRDWMPNWEHNHIGWSYALAVIGVIGSYTAGILFLIEARRHKIKRKKAEKMHAAYHMEALKAGMQSNI